MQSAEIEAKLSHLHRLKAAQEALERAEWDLKALNGLKSWRDEGQPWRVTLELEKRDQYRYNSPRSVVVEVPFSVVQQQLVDKVKQAKRRVVQLEGEQP